MKKLVVVLLTFLLILTGCNTIKVTKVEDDINTDAIRFSEEYNLEDNNNVFEYSTYDNVIDILNNGTGLLFLGYNENPESILVSDVLNKISEENNIKKIIYYNSKNITLNNTIETKELLTLLDKFLFEEEMKDEDKMLLVPLVISVKDGNIIGVYNHKSNIDNINLSLEEEKEEIKSNLLKIINKDIE